MNMENIKMESNSKCYEKLYINDTKGFQREMRVKHSKLFSLLISDNCIPAK